MDTRKLREELRKQGIYVHESDPILDTAAICDVALANTLKAIEGVVKAAADRTSAAAAQSVETSRKASEAIINDGARFMVEQFRETVRDSTAVMLAELRRESACVERARRAASVAAWVAAGASACAIAGATGAVRYPLGPHPRLSLDRRPGPLRAPRGRSA